MMTVTVLSLTIQLRSRLWSCWQCHQTCVLVVETTVPIAMKVIMVCIVPRLSMLTYTKTWLTVPGQNVLQGFLPRLQMVSSRRHTTSCVVPIYAKVLVILTSIGWSFQDVWKRGLYRTPPTSWMIATWSASSSQAMRMVTRPTWRPRKRTGHDAHDNLLIITQNTVKMWAHGLKGNNKYIIIFHHNEELNMYFLFSNTWVIQFWLW